MKAGYVALVGRPNVGKSTLLNRLIGQKLSIVSRKPQTTRHCILGIRSNGGVQVVYVDTPGIHHTAPRALNRYLNKTASSAVAGVDIVVCMIDGKAFQDDDLLVLEKLQGITVPVILAINKVDKVRDKKTLLPLMTEAGRRYPFAEIIPVSALDGTQIEVLERTIVDRLPESPPLYPVDQLTDRSERFFAAEIIREKLLQRLGDEVPHRLTVAIEQFREEGELIRIYAIIWVEREGQKRIVIGKKGDLLKKTAQQARLELEEFLGRHVYLNLWVKIKKGWSNDERLLHHLGYAE